ncbi:hypothetical protein [Methanococcoides burtonii]|uniref:hypothetical protein n=1 Tax=Methanococcoides burtonii TaxID=29291 RepID=UPI000045E0DF|nr:hypothetical protein [Methanococcoides burtonii]
MSSNLPDSSDIATLAGIAVDSLLTFVMYWYLSKKGKIVHKYNLVASIDAI